MSSKKKLTGLSIKEKLNIIKEIEEDHKEKKTVCLKYKCSISTVNRILKKKVEIHEAATSSLNLKQKRNRKGVHDAVEKALAVWFDQQRQKNAVISSMILLQKAKVFALEFGDDFEPDNNWLFRWKKRQNIKLGTIHGEISDSNKESAKYFTENILPGYMKEYSLENIMNADESALYYKALPTKTYYRPDLQPVGHKSQKVRFTLLFLCNATGTFKRVYAIGKSKNPRCLKNIAPPVPYFSNQKAWMTTSLWHEILHSIDIEMQKLNKKIILFVDNASCHKTLHLTNIVVQFIPANTTTLIQPLDKGIISAFKAYYRQIIVKKQILALERDMTMKEFYRSISYLDALHFIKRAWRLVTPSCISNCFKKAGFISGPIENTEEINEDPDLMNLIPDKMGYINCDKDVECYGELTDGEIINGVMNSDLEIDTESRSDIQDDEDEEVAQIPSLKEALTALNVLQKYCFYKNIDFPVDQVESQMVKVVACHNVQCHNVHGRYDVPKSDIMSMDVKALYKVS